MKLNALTRKKNKNLFIFFRTYSTGKPYFTGCRAKSVKASVKGMINWMNANPNLMTAERIGLLYAWNENGEGAWLTPGKTGLNPLTGLKSALKGNGKSR